MTMNVDAAPYVGNEFTYYQPDGEAVQVRLYGDEFYAVEETLDGQVIVKNPPPGNCNMPNYHPMAVNFNRQAFESAKKIEKRHPKMKRIGSVS